MAIELDVSAEHLEYLSRFMAKGDVRYYLNGIRVEPHSDGAIMVATDGHTLCSYLDPDGKCSEAVILDAPKQLIAAAMSKASSKRLIIEGGQLKIKHLQEGDVFIYPGNFLIEGNYPDWRKAIPDELVPGLIGSFNMKYIDRIYNKKARFAGGTFFHSAKDPQTSPAIYRPTFLRNGICVIMPMRDEMAPIPSWLEKQKLEIKALAAQQEQAA